MVTVNRHSDTCKIKQIASNRIVDAEIMNFTKERDLTVVMNKSVKLSLVWNGRVYEGKMAGMDFESDGPTITKIQTTLRGR